MQQFVQTAVHLVLVTPCVFIGMHFYKKQQKELDVRRRVLQRLAIVWSIAIFVVISLSVDHLWETYVM